MPHEGYADPVMNDGPIFHSDMPVSELTERDTRAIEASGISSTPTVAETTDEVTITMTSRPSTGPPLRVGARGKLGSQGDRTHGRKTTNPRRDRNQERTFSDPPNLTAIPPRGPISTKGNHRPQVTPRATKDGHGPQGPPVRKSLRKSILLLCMLGGYYRGPILGYPKSRS